MMTRFRRAALLVVFSTGVMSGASHGADADVAAALTVLIATKGQSQNVADRRAVAFYRDRTGSPVWWTGDAWSAEAAAATAMLARADAEGLVPQDYEPLPLPEGGAAERIADREWALTRGLLRYIVDVRAGRKAPKTIEPDLFVFPRDVDAAAMLTDGLQARSFGAWLSGLAPTDRRYVALRRALAGLRAAADRPEPPLLDQTPVLKPGMQDPEIAVLRARLAYWGFGAAGGHGNTANDQHFDQALADRVAAFQERRGLDADSVVGKQTRAALNLNHDGVIRRIILNLERLRWLPEPLPGRHVWVNLAAFDLAVYENDVSVLQMPAIVGRHYRKTPVMADRIVNLILHPTWTPTPRLARQDVLPKIKKNPDYLSEQGFRVFESWDANARELDPATVDWAGLEPVALKFKFRQSAGPKSALGGVRFSLTNDINIYLHDTPDKGLFTKGMRAFSSGCVRVGDAVELAAYALADMPDWTVARLAQAMEQGPTQTVKLASPLPVLLVYLTAWVDDQGRLQLREDVYERDPILAAALGLTSAP